MAKKAAKSADAGETYTFDGDVEALQEFLGDQNCWTNTKYLPDGAYLDTPDGTVELSQGATIVRGADGVCRLGGK